MKKKSIRFEFTATEKKQIEKAAKIIARGNVKAFGEQAILSLVIQTLNNESHV